MSRSLDVQLDIQLQFAMNNVLSYQNLISTFFDGNILIFKKCERIRAGVELVTKSTIHSWLTKTDNEKILKKVSSLERVFMKKWRESECNAERFKNDNAQWLQRKLEV